VIAAALGALLSSISVVPDGANSAEGSRNLFPSQICGAKTCMPQGVKAHIEETAEYDDYLSPRYYIAICSKWRIKMPHVCVFPGGRESHSTFSNDVIRDLCGQRITDGETSIMPIHDLPESYVSVPIIDWYWDGMKRDTGASRLSSCIGVEYRYANRCLNNEWVRNSLRYADPRSSFLFHNIKLVSSGVRLPFCLSCQFGEIADCRFDIGGIGSIAVGHIRNHQRTETDKECQPFIYSETAKKIAGWSTIILACCIGSIGAAYLMGAQCGAAFDLTKRQRVRYAFLGLSLCLIAAWLVHSFAAPMLSSQIL
jgi:hypothetical protein